MENKIISESTQSIKNLLIKLIDIVIEAHESSKQAISTANSKIALNVFECKDKFEKGFMLILKTPKVFPALRAGRFSFIF